MTKFIGKGDKYMKTLIALAIAGVLASTAVAAGPR
jgi:hypothetical protein